MKEWQTYTKSSQGASQGSGQPSVKEYLLIKLSDNWIAVAVLVVFLFCAVAGLICSNSQGTEMAEASKWFFDSAKLCLGVFLGLLKK